MTTFLRQFRLNNEQGINLINQQSPRGVMNEQESQVEKYYTVKELEERLSVSRSTLDRLAKNGKLQKVKFGNKTLFTGRSVNAYLLAVA